MSIARCKAALAIAFAALAVSCTNRSAQAPPPGIETQGPTGYVSTTPATTVADGTQNPTPPEPAPVPLTEQRVTYVDSTPDAATLQPVSGVAAAIDLPQATIPARTAVAARLDTTLDSSVVIVGDPVRASVTMAVLDSEGAVAFAEGTVLTGQLTNVVEGSDTQAARLTFHFDRAMLPDGSITNVSATQTFDATGWVHEAGVTHEAHHRLRRGELHGCGRQGAEAQGLAGQHRRDAPPRGE